MNFMVSSKPLLSLLTLSFTGEHKFLEKKYHRYCFSTSAKTVRLLLWLGGAIHGLFGILDYINHADILLDLWVIRYGFGIPFFVSLIIFSYSPGFKHYFQETLSIACFVAAITQIAMFQLLSEVDIQVYFTGLLLVLIFNYTSRNRFVFAIISGWSIVVAYEIHALYFNDIPLSVIISNNSYFITCNILGMIFCYGDELVSRKAFYLLYVNKLQRKHISSINVRLDRSNGELKRLIGVDGLTQAYNRQHFDEFLSKQLKLHTRSKLPLSLLLLDVDFFKNYNDHYGHVAGDECLQQVASTLKTIVRENDFVARYGGEEFVVVMPNTEEKGTENLANRILTAIRQLKIEHQASSVSPVLSLSIGGYSLTPTEDENEKLLLQRSDAALYRAKEQGRDNYQKFRLTEHHNSRPQASGIKLIT